MIRVLPFLLLLLAFATACQSDDGSAATVANPDPASTYYPLSVGGQEIKVQLAVNRDEQMKGLMYRNGLGENEGMLFIFPKAEPRGFWMKNVKFPIDIAYIDPDGVILETHHMYAHDENPVRSRNENIQYALEMDFRWFTENRVRPGDKIDLAKVTEYVKARGYNPADSNIKTPE
ncbi:MAG: DUF192 domain-containing protein [Verrucomicrobiota bacterium]